MRVGGSTSSSDATPTRGFRALHFSSIILLILYAALIIYLLTAPLYTYAGVVAGYVSIMRYSLTYYGKPLSLPSLDAASMLSIVPLSVSVLCTASSLFSAAVYASKKLRQRYLWTSAQLLFGSSLVAVSASPLLIQLRRVIEAEASNLALSNIRYTSAGLLNFGSTSVHVNTFALSLLTPPVVLIATAITLVATTLALLEYLRSKAKSASIASAEKSQNLLSRENNKNLTTILDPPLPADSRADAAE